MRINSIKIINFGSNVAINPVNLEQMNHLRFLNIRQVSQFLTKDPIKLRLRNKNLMKNEALKELTDFLEYWQNKHK